MCLKRKKVEKIDNDTILLDKIIMNKISENLENNSDLSSDSSSINSDNISEQEEIDPDIKKEKDDFLIKNREYIENAIDMRDQIMENIMKGK